MTAIARVKSPDLNGFLLIAGLILAGQASAGEWEISSRLVVSEVYTDNSCLDEESEREQWVTTVSPNVSVRGEGRRARVNLSASFQANNLDDEDQLRCSETRSGGGQFADSVDNFNPRVSGSATVEVIPDFAFVDFSVNVQQNKSDPFQAGGDDNLNFSGNQNTTYNYAISPYISWRIGSLAQLNASFDFDTQSNSDEQLDDSDRRSVSVSLSTLGRSPLTWGISGNYQEIEYDEAVPGEERGRTDQLKSVSVNLGYRFSSQWNANVTWGDDDNDFQSANDQIDGEFWRSSLSWTPNTRASVILGVGERFFGKDNSLSIRYNHKRSALILDYSKNLTYSRSLRVDEQLLEQLDASGQPIDPVTGQPVSLSNNFTTDTRSPILDERVTLAYRLQGTRTSINVSASYSDQTREEDNQASTFTDYTVSIDRRVSRYLSINSSYNDSEREATSENSTLGDDSRTRRSSLGIQYTLGVDTNLSLDYVYTERESESVKDFYDENRVTVSVNMDLK